MLEAARRRRPGSLSDYLALIKPRVILLHLITATAAVFLAAGQSATLQVLLAVWAGGGLVTAASNAFNCYFDRRIDRLMARTENRPLASGRLKPGNALLLAVVCGVGGLAIFVALANVLAAALALSGLVYYLFYTVALKRHTSLSTVIGSGAGAFPPLAGWAAATGNLGPAPIMLAFIIMLWTAPHFWTLALVKRHEYERARINILPPGNTVFWIQGGSFLLIAASLCFVPLVGMGPVYSVTALVLGSVLAMGVVRLRASGREPLRWMYFYSMVYLALLFTAMAADRLIFIPA